MPAEWSVTLLLVLCCSAPLALCSPQQASISCPGGWQMFQDSCYRLTPSKMQQNELMSACSQMGGAPVSIHSSQENSFVGRVAGGNYVWLGMKLTAREQYTWDDGSRYSYSKFLPAGNRMLKQANVGSGVLQQSCLRWNYDRVSRRLFGVCKMAALRCPAGMVTVSERCFFASERRVPWWEAESACHQQDGHATPAVLTRTDWQLSSTLTASFGGDEKLIAGVILQEGSCSWTSIQYGQVESHSCQFGCPELLRVMCSRPGGLITAEQPPEPIRMMPPLYNGLSGQSVASAGEQAPAGSDPTCPFGWTALGKRCISSPTAPVTRQQAPATCRLHHSSRLAGVRYHSSAPILASMLGGVSEAWVRDERPVATVRSSLSREQFRASGQYGIQPGQAFDSVLTAEGQVLTRPVDDPRPAVCELCQEPCGPGGVVFSGLCYKVLEDLHTLSEASRACGQLGGTLVSVETLAENSFLTALAFPSSAQCGRQPDGLWLGLQRISAAFAWEWEDCSVTSAAAWAPGAGDDGHCATLDRDGLWHDTAHCDDRRRAACKWDPCREPAQFGGTCLPLHGTGRVY